MAPFLGELKQSEKRSETKSPLALVLVHDCRKHKHKNSYHHWIKNIHTKKYLVIVDSGWIFENV